MSGALATEMLKEIQMNALPKLSLKELKKLAKSYGFELVSELGINNPLLDTDSYKASHSFQYPLGAEYVYSYIESRGGDYDKTVMVGLQMYCKQYLSRKITKAQVNEAAIEWAMHGVPFDRAMWDYIVDELEGVIPLEIRAVPEGTVINGKNVLVSVVNTDPRCAAVTSYFETQLLRAIWYPTTVATNSYRCKVKLKLAFDISSDTPDFMNSAIVFKLHDFGARGASSKESASIGGLAHLVNFKGTDTMTAIQYAREFYNERMAGFSIPAAEHSTITSWGRDKEVDVYRHLINAFGGENKIYAVVSDSYDLFNAVNELWGKALKDEIIAKGGTLVVRPDSGDPLTMPIEVIKALGEKFGYTVNSKGYKVLAPCVRVIQGDGITVDTLPIIVDNLLAAGWSIDNLAFGMGGGLLQQVNRDTYRFAMKASAIYVNGKWQDVFKDPVTDAGKKSKRGRLYLVRDKDGVYTTHSNAVGYDIAMDKYLPLFWKNGKMFGETSLAEMRGRVDETLVSMPLAA